MVRTYRMVVGENLRRLRQKKGLRQDQFARVLRQSLALVWTQATIASIEAGTYELSAEEWCLLRSLFPRKELLKGDGQSVQIGNTILDGVEWAAFVQDPEIFEGTPEDPASIDATLKPERAAAKVLQISPIEVSRLAYRLWGRGLTDERDYRLAKRTNVNHATRGHVTRELEDELRAAIRNAAKRRK